MELQPQVRDRTGAGIWVTRLLDHDSPHPHPSGLKKVRHSEGKEKGRERALWSLVKSLEMLGKDNRGYERFM